MERDKGFIIAIIGAVVVKLILSPATDWAGNSLGRKLLRACLTGIPAIWVAWFFTDPALNFLGWDSTQYRNMMAAVLALAGENLVRKLLAVTASDSALLDLIKIFRGK